MTLYLEYVILDNFVINIFLCNAIDLTFKRKFKSVNKIISSIIGTISAIFLPFLLKYNVLLILYKILTSLIMVLVLQKYKTYKQYFVNLIFLYFYTFLFGGMILGVLNLLGLKYTMSGILLYNFEFPISLIFLLFFVGYWLTKKIIKTLSKQLKFNNLIYDITLVDDDKKVKCVGFYDSGNGVSKDGQAVSIISIDTFIKLHSEYPFEKLLFRNLDHNKLKNASYISINTLSKSAKYLSFTIDKLIINRKEFNNAVVAVAIKNFENFDCILNSNLIGGEND